MLYSSSRNLTLHGVQTELHIVDATFRESRARYRAEEFRDTTKLLSRRYHAMMMATVTALRRDDF